jgi:hypothetical protein
LYRKVINSVTPRVKKLTLDPINSLIDDSITDVVTTIGSFVIKKIHGKFTRSITFAVGSKYYDLWMEAALYGILNRYNDIKKCSNLELTNDSGDSDSFGMYYRLAPGTHNLKYRNYEILLIIESSNYVVGKEIHGGTKELIYTILTYNLDPNFVVQFERDMITNRGYLMKVKPESPLVNIFQDSHEGDGYTYWTKQHAFHKRRLNTIYLPIETKKKIINTVNNFFASKEFYKKHGMSHNLKILLYGEPGPQPHSIEIPTPLGIKRFGDLQVGDKVFTETGETTFIEEIYEYKNLDVYEIEFEDGRKVLCGETHKWPVIINDDLQELSVKDMMNQTFVECSDPIRYKFNAILTNPVEFENSGEEISSLRAWTAGAILLSLDMNEKEIMKLDMNDEYIMGPMLRIFDLCYDLIKNTKDQKRSYYLYDIDKNKITPENFIRKYIPELIISYTTGRMEIPHKFLYGSLDVRLSLLMGIVGASGIFPNESDKKDDYNLIIPATNKTILSQLETLVYGLGLAAKTKITDKPHSKYYGKIMLRNDYRTFCTLSVLRQRNIDTTAKYDDIPLMDIILGVIGIKKITKLNYKENMRCLHVNHESHQYLTTGFIPTCNSGKDSIAKMIASEYNRNLFYCTGGKGGKFIPDALVSYNEEYMKNPLFLVSDIDKYPFLINDTNIDLDSSELKEENVNHKLLFGKMINALDGIMSNDNRIIIMTTNHIEKFSPVFLRPGRIDLMLEIGYVVPEVFRKFFYDTYNEILPKNIKLINNKLSVADFQFDAVINRLSKDDFLKKYTKIK